MKPICNLTLTLITHGAFTLALVSFAKAANGVRPVHVGVDGVAAYGYDVVEYLDYERATPGTSKIHCDYEGASYLFANEENRAAFLEDPETYLPAYGGWCAYGLGMEKSASPRSTPGFFLANPECFQLIDGRTHLFFDFPGFNALDAWNEDPDGFLLRADEVWETQTREDWVAGVDPKAPPEMMQFNFLNGEFDAEFSAVGPNGNVVKSKGRWSGRYTLSGHAFEDDWLSLGGSNRGTTWRTYDPVKKRWSCIWLQTGTDTPAGWTSGYFHGGMEGDDMVLYFDTEDTNGPFKARVVFYDIHDNGFRWRFDRSDDQGKTWQDGSRSIVATRIR